MTSPRRPARAEVVGSLLRPPALRHAVDAFYEEGHSAVLPEERAKDRSALARTGGRGDPRGGAAPDRLGLDVVTDGEFRRWMFLNSFYDAVEGFRTDNVVAFPQRARRGHAARGPRDRRAPATRGLAGRARGRVHGRGRGRPPVQGDLPGASIFGHPFATSPTSPPATSDLEAFVAHAIEIERALVADAIAAGARYVQFDFPLYPYLVDPRWVARFEEHGHDVDTLIDARRRGGRGGPRGHPGRGDDRAPHLPRQLPLVVDVRGLARARRRSRVRQLPYDAFLVEWDDLGPRRRVRARAVPAATAR